MSKVETIISPAQSKPQSSYFDVVSIQSQVIYGRVGNSVAVPSLQKHGLSVAAVPTVVLSNTPHYPSVHGGAIPTDWLQGYLDDLLARGTLQQLRAILVGYLGNPEQATVLANWFSQFIAKKDDLLLIIDPVLGDHDVGTYVNSGLLAAYRQHLLPLATGLTPNDYELAQLTGMSVHNQDEVFAAARTLLTGRTQWVIVTSAAPNTCPSHQLGVAVVTKHSATMLYHSRVDSACKGTGDLFTSTLLANILAGTKLEEAVSLASAKVVKVLEQTSRANFNELMI